MLGLLQELSRKRDLCAVIVLHDPNMAARHCDEPIALRQGKLLTRGSPDEIMRIEVLRDRSPGTARVLADLRALPGAGVWLAEQVPVDMESTLLALARGLRLAA